MNRFGAYVQKAKFGGKPPLKIRSNICEGG